MKLFGHHLYPPIVLLAVTEYLLAAASFAVAAFLVLTEGSGGTSRLVPWMFGFATVVVLGVTAVGLYQPKQRLRIGGIAIRLGAAVAVAALCLGVFALVSPIDGAAALWTVSFLVSLVLLGGARILFETFVDHEALRRRVLVYGAGERAASLLSLRRWTDQRGFKIVAFASAVGDRTIMKDERVISLDVTLLKYAQANNIDEVVVAMDERRQSFPIKELLECKFSGIGVLDLLTFMERETGKVKVDLLNPAWLIFSDDFSVRPLRDVPSRALDLVAAIVLAVCSFPLICVVALAIVIEDGGPVLYRQKRVGFRGVPFVLYKFRSMVKHAEAGGAAKWADKRDSRVTRVGNVIRKLRFDELPQLLNVILGDMSLVGPRPERPEFVEKLVQKIPYYHERHSVKPGITGWAQLSYPYGSSEKDAMEKLQFDLYYVKHRSLAFDIMVLLQTVEVVFWGKGAR